MDKYFKVAADLDDRTGDYFRPAGDLTINKKNVNKTNSFGNIEDYLLTVVSGRKYPYESEMGRVVGAANTIVSFDELKRMVDEGYNIVSAEALNCNLISVEFQCFSNDNDVRRGR